MKQKIGIFLALSLLCASFVAAQSDLQPIATVSLGKTESITLKQLKNRVATYQKQANMASFTLEQKKEILNAMIDEKLVVQAAKLDGIAISDGQVNQAFLQSVSQQVGQNVTETQFATIIKEQTGQDLNTFLRGQVGMNLSEYKVYLKNQLTAQQYVLSKKRTELEKAAAPTDEEVRAYYEMNKSTFVQNDILKLFLVVVPKEDDAKAAEKKAYSLLSDIENNKISFDELKIKMQQSSSSFQAGDMYVSKGTMAAQQLGIDYDALLDLFKNDIGYTSVINETPTDFQFYIIREKYAAKMLELSDIVQPDTTVTVYEYVKNMLTQQKQQVAFQKAVEEVTMSLRKDGNFRILKSEKALDALLNW